MSVRKLVLSKPNLWHIRTYVCMRVCVCTHAYNSVPLPSNPLSLTQNPLLSPPTCPLSPPPHLPPLLPLPTCLPSSPSPAAPFLSLPTCLPSSLSLSICFPSPPPLPPRRKCYFSPRAAAETFDVFTSYFFIKLLSQRPNDASGATGRSCHSLHSLVYCLQRAPSAARWPFWYAEGTSFFKEARCSFPGSGLLRGLMLGMSP